MPLQRNEFLPQDLRTVYSSPSGMADIRTGLPYQAGGLIVGGYFDLTEAEAQNLSGNQLHTGRYRFVQVDSTATSANVKVGTIGLMKSVALGVNFITSYDKGLGNSIRPVVFINAPTATQISAGAFVFVQEEGVALATYKTPLTGGGAIGDIVFSSANGLFDDQTQSGNLTIVNFGVVMGTAMQTPTGGGQGLVLLDLEVIAG